MSLTEEPALKFLRYTALLCLLSACFRTVIPGPDGKSVTVKTPCDSQIWLVTKKYGEPTQVILKDHEYYRIRYYFASTKTEYGFGWNDLNGCYVGKQLHLTGDGIL